MNKYMEELTEMLEKGLEEYATSEKYRDLLHWYQNTIDTFSTQLPELAYGNITAEEFCTKLSESAAKNQE